MSGPMWCDLRFLMCVVWVFCVSGVVVALCCVHVHVLHRAVPWLKVLDLQEHPRHAHN